MKLASLASPLLYFLQRFFHQLLSQRKLYLQALAIANFILSNMSFEHVFDPSKVKL